MSDGFDLDLRSAEAEIDEVVERFDGRVVLGVLDGTTDPDEWVDTVTGGNVLLLAVDGDLNDLAVPFASDVKEAGATLMHFRDFLVLAPPGVEVDTERL
jgi:hypothetical protein